MGRTKGSGQGSVYKRGDKWRGQIIIDGRRLSHTADRKKDVLDWMANIRADATLGFVPPEVDYTVSEWLDIYFDKWYQPRVNRTTYQNNKRLLEYHVEPVLGDVLLKDLTSSMIQDAYPKMFDKAKNRKDCNYSDRTIKLCASLFRRALAIASDEGFIKKNPHTNIAVPKTGKVKHVDSYDAKDFRKIIEYTKAHDGPCRVFYLLAATGMRLGECLALTWDDVNLEEGWINITKTAKCDRGRMYVQYHPKTEQSVRRVYISDNITSFLKGIGGTNDKNSNELILKNKLGSLYSTSALRVSWMIVCDKLGIPYKNLHALRHSWATMALENNVPVHTVSKMLGHKSIATTLDVYKSVFTEQKQEAAKIMNDLV